MRGSKRFQIVALAVESKAERVHGGSRGRKVPSRATAAFEIAEDAERPSARKNDVVEGKRIAGGCSLLQSIEIVLEIRGTTSSYQLR